MGELSILNVAGGDIKITLDRDNVSDQLRAKRVISDLLLRGYALLIEVDGKYQRALGFDEAHGEYIIADLDPSYAVQPKEQTNGEEQASNETEAPPKKYAGRGRKRVAMETTNAVGVARSAGG